MIKFIRFLTIVILVFSFSITVTGREPVKAKRGIVVSVSKLASEVGVAILKKGGNAIDAAAAVGFALAVTHPAAGNLGGGGFMVIHFADGKNTTIDFREKAPAKASRDMYLDKNGNYVSALSRGGVTSVGVPGSVAGLIYALDKYGALPLTAVIQPAIKLAYDGFRLTWRETQLVNEFNDEFNKYPSSKDIFTNNGEPLLINQIFLQNDLAETLTRIKLSHGKDFYEGKTAELFVKQVEKLGGIITLEDMKNYSPVERAPIEGTYRGYEIISMPPPSSGGIALLEALNALENYSFSKDDWGSSATIHKIVEILKRVYADRSKHLGDSDFYDVPVEKLTSKEYGKKIYESITEKAKRAEDIFPANYRESSETTHYSIADEKGNVVSVTTTINSSFGNKIVVEGAGFLMNNEMDDFSAKPGEPNLYGLIGSEANSIQPNKRMLSSMTPTIVLRDGKPYIVTGASGGSRIITSVLQVIMNVIDFGMNIQQAADKPRIHNQWLPDKIFYEDYGLTEDVKNALIAMGHKIGKKIIVGRTHSILIDSSGVKWGAPDPRTFGAAVGY
ncbi:MAG: gamma-glutamyltransferase [Chlorobi bacterium]|nr:gamma-glutamyltransferase [Chlorobiota bacterium]